MSTQSAKKYPIIVSLVIVALFGIGWWLLRDAHLPVLSPSGSIASQQRDLIVFTVVLALVVVVPVFVMLAVFAWRYRDGAKAHYQPEWADNKKLEFIWWGIPIAIIILLSVVTYITSHSLDPYKPIQSTKPALEVQVVALQWKWLFIYPDQKIATINDLTIPAGRPVHFNLSADAPMSAFWVPALGGQIYTMGAMNSQLHLIADHQGVYDGYNTNINGQGYAKMTFKVNALSDEKFETWVKNFDGSNHVLNQMHFDEIRQPSIEPMPMYMRLEDQNLYHNIVMKQMNSTSDSKQHEGHGM